MPDVRRERTRIQLCGRLSIEIDETEHVGRLRGRQVPQLLAYLALARDRAVSRDELAQAMWPESPPRSQDAALRTLLSRLRSALGGEVVAGREEITLELPQPVWVDVEAASAQVPRALAALERGDARAAWALAQVPLNIAARGLLPGVSARWLEPRRQELSELRLQALEVIGRAGLRLGGSQLGSVERAGRTLIELERFRESGYVLLMEALAAQGNVAEGVRVFERLRLLLRDDLGTVPSPEAMVVHQRLLGARPAASTGPAPVPAIVPAPVAARIALPALLQGQARDPFVGRRHELTTLRGWWSAGEETMLLLAGEAGMGKSRLQSELAREVQAGGEIVLAGHAPDEALVPYQPLLDAIGHFVEHASPAALQAAIDRADEAGAELARLVPELRRRLPELRPVAPGDPDTDRYRLFEAVAGLLGAIAADGRLLIVLDDLHWADRPTLLLMRHLLRSRQAPGLRVLGAYRTGEDGAAALSTMLAPLRREGRVRGLDVGGLPRADATELLRVRAGGTLAAGLAGALYDETEGNPFFIAEMLRHLEESGIAPLAAGVGELRRVGLPEDVRELISRRLQRVSADGLEWLRGGAVIGREFDAALLERTLGYDEDRFLDALEECLEARLVAEVPGVAGRYAFSHALVRETLYAGTSSARRARIHRRVGLALELRARPGDASGSDIAALAHHFTLAGAVDDPERAITYALAAGAQATERYANQEAAEHYARALAVLDHAQPGAVGDARRLALLLELGEAWLRSGDRPEAWPAFRQAAALAVQRGDREALIRAAIGASRRFIQPPGLVEEELIAMLEQALALTAGEGTVTRVRLLARLCVALSFTPRRDEMRRLSAEATSIAAHLGDREAAALAAGARRRAWWGPDQLERRLADSTMLLRSAREAGEVELILQGHLWLVLDLMEAGDRAAVEAQIDAFAAEAQALRQPLLTWSVLTWRAMLALLDGRLAEAERLAGDALASGMRVENSAASQFHLLQLVAIRREQGRGPELAEAIAQRLAATAGRAIWEVLAALLALDAGDEVLARARAQSLLRGDAAPIPRDGDWLGVMVLLAELACGLGDATLAARQYETLVAHAETVVVLGVGTVCQGTVTRWLGRLALLLGRREDAIAHLERALVLDAALGARCHAAHVQLDLAQALGPAERSRDLLAAAARTAQECDLPLLARRAEATGVAVG